MASLARRLLFAGRMRAAEPDRPRERLWRRGTRVVSDEELLAILVGTGTRGVPAVVVASELVRRVGGLAALSRASPHELAQVVGVGDARAATIVAAFELGRRAMERTERSRVMSAEDVFQLCAPRLAGLHQELFLAIGLDVHNGLLDVVEIARGSVAGVEVFPREVFRPLVRMAAAGGVLVHNHPSGDPTPSDEDLDLTDRMREVGDLLGIPIIDHVVIAAQHHRSIADHLCESDAWPVPD